MLHKKTIKLQTHSFNFEMLFLFPASKRTYQTWRSDPQLI